MPLELLHGIVAKKFLSVDDIAAIRHLAAVCESHEYTRLRISWAMLQTRPGDFPLDFLYYDDGKIVGYLALDDRGVETKELFGMVHPAYRRQGIFQLLFEAAKDVCRSRAVKRLVLTCERASPAGQAFVRSVGATYDFSEHEMVLRDFCPRLQFDDRLSVRLADVEDIDALTFVQAAAFDDPEAVVRRRITTFMKNPLCRYYLLQSLSHVKHLPGEASVAYGEPVGSLRLELDEEIGIYAFGIHPAYRRRGYGRQMLEEVIYQLLQYPLLQYPLADRRNEENLTPLPTAPDVGHSNRTTPNRSSGFAPGAGQDTSQKAIVLDVETDNIHALSLYRSCGFQIRAKYDYYNCYIKS
jgi:ribosomal protein S18 acetylase RimI-like enzyme